MTACARTASARQASRSTIVVSIASGSLIDILIPLFISFFGGDVKGTSRFGSCIFSSSLDRFGHLPVPSEDFAPCGKKFWIFHVRLQIARIAQMKPSAEHFTEKSRR